MSKTLTYNATVSERVDLEPTLSIFRLRHDVAASAPAFRAGQYTTLGLNSPENTGRLETGESVRRPMSIASAPQASSELEFYIRYVTRPESNLPLTHLMWPLDIGDRLYCRTKAVGKFTIEDSIGLSDPRLKLMIAAGTGLAPFMSVVRSRVCNKLDARLDDIIILHGASYPSSLGYQQELESLVQDHGLRYLATISRPQECPEWNGATGRVESLLAPDRIEVTEQALALRSGTLCPQHAAAYICGLQGTLSNAISHLLSRGYVPNHRRLRQSLQIDPDLPASLFFEQYDSDELVLPGKDRPSSRTT